MYKDHWLPLNLFDFVVDFPEKIIQVKFADASKNKKLYKTGFDVSIRWTILKDQISILTFEDVKNGQPLYAPIDQAGSYSAQTLLYHQWPPMAPPVQVPGQPGVALHPNQHHPIYGQSGSLRPPLTGFNHSFQPYLASAHEGGSTYVLPVPVQQLQQLHITSGHPGSFCIMNPAHPGIFMTPQQTGGQVPSQHDSWIGRQWTMRIFFGLENLHR